MFWGFGPQAMIFSSSSWFRPRHSPMGRTDTSCLCPGRSHGQTGTLVISSRLAHLSDTSLLLECPTSYRFASRNQNVLAGFQPKANEYARFHTVFGVRSICQWTHSIPHSFVEHASAHVVSATSPPNERYLPIGPNCVQVQHRGGIQGMAFDSGGFLHLSCSFLSVLTMPPTSRAALSANPCPA